MSRKWEEQVRKVVPYVPGEQPKDGKVIKLNTNENPYPPSTKVIEAMKQIEEDTLRLYPDPEAKDLVESLANYYNVSPKQVFVGVGSDDVLAMAFLTFFNHKLPILFPDITYSFYDVWADLFRIPFQCQPLDAEFKIKKEDYFVENGGIIFPNPNAPTGVAESLDVIEEIIKANEDVIVIIDEAYVDFGTKSAISLLPKYENLLVVQTFSKSRAMAGMRIGYAIGNEKLISYLNDAKFSFNSYTMNRTSLAMGKACVEDDAYFKDIVQKVVKTREKTKVALKELGFSFPDAKSNFIFATHNSVPAKEIFEACKKNHIFVRYFNKPRIDNYLRITIGTDEEMEELIDFLTKYLSEQ